LIWMMGGRIASTMSSTMPPSSSTITGSSTVGKMARCRSSDCVCRGRRAQASGLAFRSLPRSPRGARAAAGRRACRQGRARGSFPPYPFVSPARSPSPCEADPGDGKRFQGDARCGGRGGRHAARRADAGLLLSSAEEAPQRLLCILSGSVN
jgi:hypothetical protein